MGDTFGGEWHRPGATSHKCKDRQRGHSQRQLQERASYDNEPQLGCGAMFLLCVLAVAAALGVVLS
ncbi:hypothetical protein [Streptomyces sp. NPDC057623]|uniref:hypothetical protein n=1 Tax=Streptomyces sp. NPDC057623 TaxID=3346187 RepID=UPI003688BBD1